MKTITIRILSAALMLSIVFAPTAKIFAEEATSTPEVTTETSPVTTEVTVEPSVPAPTSTEPTSSTLANMPVVSDEGTSTPLVATTSDPILVATSTPTTTDPLAEAASTTGSTTIDLDNTATTTNNVDAQAATGDNTATSTTGTSTIQTGNALANANVTNMVNVNVFNSDALLAFISRMMAGDSSVDLRDLIFGVSTYTPCDGCSFSYSPFVNATTTNSADITNNVNVNATTGNNTASSTGGASVQTGNAYANANVANVVNTNIINSQYLVLVFNNYGNMTGDIVLPNAQFFDSFATATTTVNSTAPVITTDNAASVNNNASTTASTGTNDATGTSTAIVTGQATAGTTVVNHVNENQIGGTRVALVFRIWGNWSGKAFNLPSSFTWRGTPVGVEFLSTGGTSANGSSGSVSTSNSALVNNNVNVQASTGNNTANGSGSSISTGNAFAVANIFNMVNTNIIGANWITAIINIFGDWSGNISFGQPNLWVGSRASFDNNYNGERGTVQFTYTVKNNGDAPAHNVKLTHTIEMPYVVFSGTRESSRMMNIGTLAPGETRTITETGYVTEPIPYGTTPVSNSIVATQDETDADPRDNKDVLNYTVYKFVAPSNNNFKPIYYGVPANFVLTATNSATGPIIASSTVDYTIVVKNMGGVAEKATLVDEIKDESGNVIHTESWDLGKVETLEEITVSYTAFYNASTTPGVYTNYAQVKTFNKDAYPDSAIATSTVTIVERKIAAKPLASLTLAPKKVLGATKTAATTATTTDETVEEATTTPVIARLSSDLPQSPNFAAAFAAFGKQWWYWYLFIIIAGTAYIIYRNRSRYYS